MSDKGKLALYWAASCGGCEIAVLAVNEKILDIANAFDVVFWPVAVDGKVHHIEAMPDQYIDVCLFNGAIRTSEQEYMARLMRAKSKVLVAFGACAAEGGIPALGNVANRQQIFDTAYRDTPTTENPFGLRPQAKTEVEHGTLSLPVFYDTVKTLAQTVEVDYFLPGCPPEPERIWDAVVAILSGSLPAAGSVIGSPTTVCNECTRTRNEKKLKAFKRVWEIIPDPDLCLLDQGLLCNGIVTRAGCGALCPQVSSPCIGCYGPTDGVEDFGARLMGALASVVDSNDPAEIDRIIRQGIPDPVGQFYRFSFAKSQLRRAALPSNGNGRAQTAEQA